MGTGKIKAGNTVIKLVFIKPDDLKILSMMIAVTGSTIFSPDLRGGMETLVLVNPFSDFSMTGQAFIIGDLVSQGMT